MTGISPSPYDSRDYRYNSSVRGLPDTVSLKEHARVIDDQSITNACTAHSTTTAMEILLDRAGGYVALSRLWAYWYGRTEEQRRVDAGANLRNMLKAAARTGVVEEQHYPFDTSKVNWPAPAYDLTLGQKYSISRYLSIGTNTDYDIQQVKAALASGLPVVFGMDLTPAPWSMPGMLHAQCIIGYDQSGFIVENSWGPGWGDGGFAKLGYSDYKQYAFEAWVIDGLQGINVPLNWSMPMSKTRVFLDIDETFTASGVNYTVYGGGNSVLRLTPGCEDIEFDQNIHTVEIPYTDPVVMSFMQTGNILHIYVGMQRVAYGAIKRDGLTLVTDNGQITTRIRWEGPQMYWENTPIGNDGPTKTWS